MPSKTRPMALRLPLTLLAGIGLLGGLAACVAPAAAQTSSANGYTDGTYTADGSYQAPSGTESITVELTIADNTVTAVTVTGHATDREAVEFQDRFAGGIQSAIVGKSLDSLSVSRVAGSSLTSVGFNTALATIKRDATA